MKTRGIFYLLGENILNLLPNNCWCVIGWCLQMKTRGIFYLLGENIFNLLPNNCWCVIGWFLQMRSRGIFYLSRENIFNLLLNNCWCVIGWCLSVQTTRRPGTRRQRACQPPTSGHRINIHSFHGHFFIFVIFFDAFLFFQFIHRFVFSYWFLCICIFCDFADSLCRTWGRSPHHHCLRIHFPVSKDLYFFGFVSVEGGK